MGNRAVITTQKDLDTHGVGMYLHWNGGYDSVKPLLDYCQMRGFAAPDRSDYGYARMAQVMANFLGGDGYSIGVGLVDRMDQDNYDNGTYVLNGWKVVARRFFSGEEQSEYDHDQFMEQLDECQPEDQQIGRGMMRCLRTHGRSLPEVSSQYHYSIMSRQLKGVTPAGFRIGRFYAPYRDAKRNVIEVLEVDGDWMTVSLDGDRCRVPRFVWKDGCESTVFEDEDLEEHIVDSMTEVGS